MKRLISSALFCGLTHAIAFSQNTDSLRRIAALSRLDTTVVDANKELSILFQENHPDSAIHYAGVAVRQALQLRDTFRAAQSYKSIGVAYDNKGELDSCLAALDEALRLFGLIRRDDYRSHTLTDKALAYFYKGNYELALRTHLTALDIRKRIGEEKPIAQSYNNIGLVYRSRKDYANAIRFYKESAAIKARIRDGTGVLNTRINIGAAYQSSGQFDSAYRYAVGALALAKELKSHEDVIASKENIAAALINLNRPDEALRYLQEADRERGPTPDKKHLFTHAQSYGDLWRQKGDLTRAIRYFEEGLSLAQSTGRTELAEVFTRKLASCHYEAGNYKRAYELAMQSRALHDTLLNAESARQVAEMSAVYETAEKEGRIQKLSVANALTTAEAAQRAQERNYFILATALFLGLAAVAFVAVVNNRKKNRLLAAQNKFIEASLAEKEVLLREIHHRVKNNLQIVSSLLSLQSSYITDEGALDAIRESRARVHSMSLIHQNLYTDEGLIGIDVDAYISALATSLFHSYNIRENIALETDIAPLKLDVDTVIPLGLILNELLTNCLKYAFVNRDEGRVRVALREEEGSLLLSVHDDGVGLPPDAEAGAKKSFGHKMISAFLQKLKGTMDMRSDDGARVDIRIKNYKFS